MKRMKKFMVIGRLKNSGELSFGGSDDDEFEDFSKQHLCSLLSNDSFTSYEIIKNSQLSKLSF